jgi:hypothetical protein
MTKVTLLSLDDRIVIGILGKHSLEFFEIVKKLLPGSTGM